VVARSRSGIEVCRQTVRAVGREGAVYLMRRTRMWHAVVIVAVGAGIESVGGGAVAELAMSVGWWDIAEDGRRWLDEERMKALTLQYQLNWPPCSFYR